MNRKFKLLIFPLVSCLFACNLLQANGYSLKSETDSLSENAYAIVRNYSAVFSQTDINNAIYKVTKVITVLDKRGEMYGNFYGYGDKFIELKDFSGTIKNSAGTVIKKIGKKDLVISSLSEHLASDNYSITYECKSPSYPYTVEYTYEEKWKNGIVSYPSFTPILGTMQSVEEASYRIELPGTMGLRYKNNFDCNITEEIVDNRYVYNFSIKKPIKAIQNEPLAPPFRERSPRVSFAPADFCYDSSCGNMSNWQNYGSWLSTLLAGRDALPATLSTKLNELVKDAQDDREKVKRIYKYLQDNSRYVSIQLGIGGFQPIEASSVIKSNFGDCKGLSNLMKAMLKEVGISSYYCEINMREQRYLDKDFSNINQTNHAIVLVPLKNDSIWLECTSQKLPFGYVHDGIAGHDALIVTENGGKLCRLPSYSHSDNKSISKLTLNVFEDGKASGNVSFAEHLHAYDNNVSRIMSNDREKQVSYINQNLKLPRVQIGQITVSEDKSDRPSCTLDASFEASDIVNRTGNRLFISLCPLNKTHLDVFATAKRTSDILMKNGFSEEDSITFVIPESYIPESLPKDIALETPFGTLKTHTIIEANKIVYTQNISVFAGQYSSAEYTDIKRLFSEITSAAKRKLVLKKI